MRKRPLRFPAFSSGRNTFGNTEEYPMRYCILFASPRPDGNTATLLKPFVEELEAGGSETDIISLYERKIEPCYACRACQKDISRPGCIRRDDMETIAERILASDCLVTATPIYGWYCTAPMKAALDRLIYMMCKFYGERRGPALWEGKAFAILTTCGYPPNKGADVYEEGMKRYCRHCHLRYAGMYAAHDPGYDLPFASKEKLEGARQFARRLQEAAAAR